MAASKTSLQTSRQGEMAAGCDTVAELRRGIDKLQSRLGMRGWAIIAAVLIAAGLALNWSGLVAIGAAPVLLGLLPCAMMCALGLCMTPKGQGSRGQEQTGNRPSSDDTAPPAA